ncbi:MAG: hypothetical protein ABSD64_12295 [Terriglobales bacterium]|jgi:hypothetical protein
MKIHPKLICCFLPVVFLSGCKKSGSTQEKPAASTNATSATTAPTASAPAAAPGSADAGASAETTAKMAAAEWALKQDEIKRDPNGQWAIQATASSTYSDAQGTAGWSANQAAGAPNVDKYGDNGAAWAPKTPDGGIEWLDLKYPRPVHATEVRVRESCGSGAVIKIEVYDEQGGAHAVWQGNDPTTELNYLMVKFPKTTFKTDRVKVTLATNVVPGWNEIDAVQLVGADQ